MHISAHPCSMPFQTDMLTVCVGSIQKARHLQGILSHSQEDSPLPPLGRPWIRPCPINPCCNLQKQRLSILQQQKQHEKQHKRQPRIRPKTRPLPSVKNLIRRLFGFNPKMCAIPNESDREMYKKREAVMVSLFLFIVCNPTSRVSTQP